MGAVLRRVHDGGTKWAVELQRSEEVKTTKAGPNGVKCKEYCTACGQCSHIGMTYGWNGNWAQNTKKDLASTSLSRDWPNFYIVAYTQNCLYTMQSFKPPPRICMMPFILQNGLDRDLYKVHVTWSQLISNLLIMLCTLKVVDHPTCNGIGCYSITWNLSVSTIDIILSLLIFVVRRTLNHLASPPDLNVHLKHIYKSNKPL